MLPCSAYELENAAHQEELPKRHYTWVRVLAGQMGVGGDDSWGAPVHPQYLMPADREWRIVFTIQQDCGEKGLALAEELHLHIVLADIVMPVMDGIEFSAILGKKHPEIQLIILSS